MLLPHGRELIGFLPISDLDYEFREHERLRVFNEKGVECVTCGRAGTVLAISRELATHKRSVKRGTVGKTHIDLYTDDFVLMTADHIIPKAICKEFNWSEAETEHISNKQPMCDPCNSKKSDKLISDYDMSLLRAEREKSNRDLKYGSELIRDMMPRIKRMMARRR
jgi:5-methylcytosine-specific restriction endonuclease McrA